MLVLAHVNMNVIRLIGCLEVRQNDALPPHAGSAPYVELCQAHGQQMQVHAGLTVTGIMVHGIHCYVRSKSDRISLVTHTRVEEPTDEQPNRRSHFMQ